MQDTGNFDVLSFGAVILANGVPDVPVVYRPVSAGSALVPPGKVQFCPCRGEVAGFIPVVGLAEKRDCLFPVVALLRIAVVFQGISGFFFRLFLVVRLKPLMQFVQFSGVGRKIIKGCVKNFIQPSHIPRTNVPIQRCVQFII